MVAKCEQLDLFQDIFPFRDEEIILIKNRVEKVQKGIFKRHDVLNKKTLKLEEQLEKAECRLYALEKFIRDKFGENCVFDGTLGINV